jgi:hypothetical protein
MRQGIIALLRNVLLLEVKEEFIRAHQVNYVRNFLLKRLADLIHLVNVKVLLLILLLSCVVVTDGQNYSHVINAEICDVTVVHYDLKLLYTKLNVVMRCI